MRSIQQATNGKDLNMAATDINALGLTAKASYSFTFDLSESQRSNAFFIPPGVASFSVEVDWTSTGTPTGAFTLEVSNNEAATSGKAMTVTADTDFVAQQPGHASDTGSFFLDNVKCSARRVWLVYTAASGGTGAVATVRFNFRVQA